MGFVDAVRVCLFERYFDFSGRASRSEFWWFHLFYFLVVGVGGAAVLGVITLVQDQGIQTLFMFAFIFSLFPLAIPVLSVTIRRFHDRNMSGWVYFLLSMVGSIPCIGLIGGIVMLIIMVSPGTIGTNRYGVDPLSPDYDGVFM